MRPWPLVLRMLCVVSLAVWVGGLTFYGAVVVPVLHDVLDGLVAGSITRRVTDTLNLIGVATLAIWGVSSWLERSLGPPILRRARWGLLAIAAACLAVLLVLHRVMDERLDARTLGGFYPIHRAYLITTTVQWFAGLGLLATALAGWTGRRPTEPGEPLSSN
jgi:hypothetical protein